jgi:hypothetical protein
MMCGLLTFCCVSRSEMFAKNVSAFAENISVYFFGGHGDRRDSPTSFTALLAPNLLAQFSLQIDIQILGLESPKVCGNHALLPFRGICSTMKLWSIQCMTSTDVMHWILALPMRDICGEFHEFL